jgi:hypothetical protein
VRSLLTKIGLKRAAETFPTEKYQDHLPEFWGGECNLVSWAVNVGSFISVSERGVKGIIIMRHHDG